MALKFVFDETYQLLVCRSCQSSLPPTRTGQERHLRLPSHGYRGHELQTLLDVFQGYGQLRNPEEGLEIHQVPPNPIPGLRIHSLYGCNLCDSFLFSRTTVKLFAHINNEHDVPRKQQLEHVHWRHVDAQTLYSEKQHIAYFEVHTPSTAVVPPTPAIPQDVNNFFERLASRRAEDIQQQQWKSAVLVGFEAHRSEVVPWLQRTGIMQHLDGLPVEKVLSSYKRDPEPRPWTIVLEEATNEIFEDALAWAMPGPESEMSYATSLAMCQFSPLQGVEGKTHSFLAHKQPGTLVTYFRYWKQFLVYWENIQFHNENVQDGQIPGYWFSPGEGPEGVLGPDFRDDVQGPVYRTVSAQPVSTDRYMETLPQAFYDLITCKPGGDGLGSALVSYAAMLAIKPSNKQWKEPGDFNSHLSGIIWVCQLLLFYYCVLATNHPHIYAARLLEQWPEIENTSPSVNETVRRVFQDVARQDSESALGVLLNWRDLLFSVSKSTMKVREAIWNLEQTELTYVDTKLALTDVTKIILSEFKAASDVLYQDLLLGPDGDGLQRMKADMFTDNLRHTTAEESLLDVCQDRVPKHSLEHAISQSRNLRAIFLNQECGSGCEWSVKAINHYEAVVQKFLQHLLVLIHLGGGQPLRAPEILSTKWKNTQHQTRSIFVLHNRVMMRINYHKGLQQTGKVKDNMRFFPGPIGQLLLDFLVYVQPLREEFLRQSCPDQKLSPFLWEKGLQVWGDDRVTKAMEQACARAQAPKLHVSNWRQFTVAIVKAKFGADIHCFDLNPGDEEAGQADDESDIAVMHRQRNHTSFTANHSYANQHSFGGISDQFFQRSYRASSLWASLFKLESGLETLQKRPNPEADGDGEVETGLMKRIKLGKMRDRRVYRNGELLLVARGMYGNPKLQWRSPEQSRAMDMIMSGTKAAIVVLPTGAGKSLLFMLPCKLEEAQTTILVLPLVSLRGDMLRRLKELKIKTAVWTQESRPTATLVIVSAEAAVTSDFKAYCLTLISTNRLDRIVIDECHLTITANDYRKTMSKLAQLRGLECKFLYLTATLPPSMEPEFKHLHFLAGSRTVRGSSDRPNIVYDYSTITNDNWMNKVGYHIKRGTSRHQLGGNWSMTSKVLVYCQTIAAAEEMGEILDCPVYHSKSGSAEEKEVIIRDWLYGPDVIYMAATSALSAGFDYPEIRRVYHVLPPKTLVDFAQESGRAGRDGGLAVSMVYGTMETKAVAEGVTKVHLPPRERAMMDWIGSGECFRRQLSVYLDYDDCYVPICLDHKFKCKRCRDKKRVDNPVSRARAIKDAEKAQPADRGPSGVEEMALRMKEEAEQLATFVEDLDVLRDTCTSCRVSGRDWDHIFDRCRTKYQYINAKTERSKMGRKKWFPDYSCCYRCSLPQSICGEGFSADGQKECIYKDILMPYCYALSQVHVQWVYDVTGIEPGKSVVFLDWLGEAASFGGIEAINAVKLMAMRLSHVALST